MLFENRLRLAQKFQRGIPLTLSIENVDKDYWKCEGESNRWGYVTDEHQKAITLSAMERSCKHFIPQFAKLQYFNDGQNKHL